MIAHEGGMRKSACGGLEHGFAQPTYASAAFGRGIGAPGPQDAAEAAVRSFLKYCQQYAWFGEWRSLSY